ncbi:MAG: hypothetical protein GC184_00940 [Rhizobiales bacterium]|nr:hypothetical protein [Hyphomicrobiales bacterium]
MSDFSAAQNIPHAGKHNMATAAFEELRAARRENRAPATGGELSFNDIIDTLNPLQHIPVVSDIYRNLTGDKISDQARVMGGALYGGPIGVVAAVASSAIAAANEGQDIGAQALASLFGEDEKAVTATTSPEIAALETATPQAAKPVLTPEEMIEQSRKADEITGSLAAKSTTGNKTKDIPELSPQAFQALMGSFGEKADAPAAAPTTLATETRQTPTSLGTAKKSPTELMAAMQEALDKYQALKLDNNMPTRSLNF